MTRKKSKLPRLTPTSPWLIPKPHFGYKKHQEPSLTIFNLDGYVSTSTKGGRGRESIDTDRTKDFPHGLKIPILRGPPFRSWASNQSGYKHAIPEERACKRCARRASSYEKTVVLSRERFAADNRRPVRFVHRRLSLQNPSTTPHRISPCITPRTDGLYTHCGRKNIHGSRITFKFFEIVFENSSKSVLSRERRIYYCERKVTFRMFTKCKYKYYAFDILYY